jgi:hypothetical protein
MIHNHEVESSSLSLATSEALRFSEVLFLFCASCYSSLFYLLIVLLPFATHISWNYTILQT